MSTLGDSQSSTRALIARGRAGDRSALDRLFGRVMTRLRIWAHGRMPAVGRGQAATHDVVQDAALGVWQQLDHVDFRKPGDLDAYARRAVMNRIRDQARRGLARSGTIPLVPGLIDDRPTVEDDLLRADLLARCERAFAALPLSDREAVIARTQMGYSFEQIAQITGKPSAAAARMAVTRALDQLRRAADGDSE